MNTEPAAAEIPRAPQTPQPPQPLVAPSLGTPSTPALEFAKVTLQEEIQDKDNEIKRLKAEITRLTAEIERAETQGKERLEKQRSLATDHIQRLTNDNNALQRKYDDLLQKYQHQQRISLANEKSKGGGPD